MPAFELLFLILITICTTDVTKEANGEKFEDLFNEFDSSLWFKINDQLDCEGFEQCVYTKEENVELHSIEHIDQRKPRASEIQLLIRNDCDEPHCCGPDFCTPYTTGTLTSVKTYGYGSYRFHARPISTFVYSNNYHDVWSCMSIVSKTTDIPMGFSTCIPSEAPQHAAFMWNYNGTTHDEVKTLPINAGRRFAVYGIDWEPESVSWSVNGVLMMRLNGKNFTFPDKPLHIKVSIIPQRAHVSPEPLHQANDVELRFRLRAIKAVLKKSSSESTSEKTELFTKPTKSKRGVWIVSGGLMILVFAIWSMYESRKAHDFYAPLASE